MKVLTKKLIFVLITISIASCNSGNYSTDNPDPFCKRLLSQDNPVELRKWLYDGKSTLGELGSNEDSISLAEQAYKAGAVNIYGVDIESDAVMGKNTGWLVIELPSDKSKRKAIIEWAAPIAWDQGFDAYSDVGQKYIFVGLD